jgi:release factor glutamine methyltransferase
MARVAELLGEADGGIDARRDAEVLLCRVLGKPRSYLFAWPEAEVDAAAAGRFRDWLGERRRGVPVAQLVGEREFWSLSLRVSPATLIPRPETELLVELALDRPLPDAARVLDLGTGTGAVAIALARERPAWFVTAVDRCGDALAVARENAARHCADRLRCLAGDWFDPVAGERFDLVVSNPPYVAADDPCLAEGDLRFEARGALVAGRDGYADLERIIAASPDYLEAGGWLILEHGSSQGARVRRSLVEAGFASVATHRDLAGHERASLGRRAGRS